MARSFVAREMVKLGGQPQAARRLSPPTMATSSWTCAGCTILNPVELESAIDRIPGVVTNGLFARRPADLLLLGTPHGVQTAGTTFAEPRHLSCKGSVKFRGYTGLSGGCAVCEAGAP